VFHYVSADTGDALLERVDGTLQVSQDLGRFQVPATLVDRHVEFDQLLDHGALFHLVEQTEHPALAEAGQGAAQLGLEHDEGGNDAVLEGVLQQRPDQNRRTDVEQEVSSETPSEFRLDQNYPNPFNPVTMIRYALPQSGHVTVTVYSILGQPVSVLVDQHQEAGTYRVTWDGTDDSGNIVATGLYLYRLETPEFAQTRRMVFVK
jgi:hypothetical protein